MIVFASHRTLSRMVDVEILVSSGTFFACPKMFQQVYTIHGVLSDRSGQSVTSSPLVYAFPPNKEKLTYEVLFQHLNDYLASKNIVIGAKSFKFDFEFGAMNAARTVFPGLQIYGCNFHFNAALLQRVKDLKLQSSFLERESEVRRKVRRKARTFN